MSIRKIRVVKRGAAVQTPVLIRPAAPRDVERGVTSTVETWISERRENDVTERTFSGRQIVAWSQLPDISGKPA